jgi:hypothetical protein
VMFGFQPTVIGAAEFRKRSEFDHGIFPWFEFRWHLDMPSPEV